MSEVNKIVKSIKEEVEFHTKGYDIIPKIKELVTAVINGVDLNPQNWIDTKTEKPPVGEEVLCIVEEQRDDFPRFHCVLFRRDDDSYALRDIGTLKKENCKIVYWQDLPPDP